jgi:hypothetical protein
MSTPTMTTPVKRKGGGDWIATGRVQLRVYFCLNNCLNCDGTQQNRRVTPAVFFFMNVDDGAVIPG